MNSGHDSSKEKRIDLMTEAIINLPDHRFIRNIERSRLSYRILRSYYGISPKEIDDWVANSDVGSWYNCVIEIVISNAMTELYRKEEACRILSRELVDLDLI